MHKKRAILIGVSLLNNKKEYSLESIKELATLSFSANFEIIDKIIQIRERIHPKYFLGKGKLKGLSEDVTTFCIDTVIFNHDLSPLQTRCVESILKCEVIGRTELILYIFATRARTKEAKLQVEYAQLSYLYPRLTRRWTHLSRIEGGIGLRGPGETQLEVDRRAIKKRLHSIKEQLKKVSVQFNTKRKLRKDKNIVCLVGYTNAGKSSLLNTLSKNSVYVDNALFTTLDSTIKQVYISLELKILLIDTVGFIKNIPHHLIASFKSTLEEIKSAKLLLHVIDITEEYVFDRIESVNQVLRELDTLNRPTIFVFNKVDNLKNLSLRNSLQTAYENSCFTSSKTGEGLLNLKSLIKKSFLIPKVF